MAVEARHQLDLDRVLLVVAGDPWQKSGRVVAPGAARLAMVEAAIADIDGLEASDIELVRGGPTYTADTVAELAADDRELFLVLGADAVGGLASWKRIEEIRHVVTLASVDRGCELATMPPVEGWRQVSVAMPRLDIASTELRDRLSRGEPVDGLVPAAAIRVIRELGLYTHRR
jgi:nicotinate-nucleotide adenylyltransferase